MGVGLLDGWVVVLGLTYGYELGPWDVVCGWGGDEARGEMHLK